MPAIFLTFKVTLKSDIEKLLNNETQKDEDVSEKTEQEVVDMIDSGKYSFSVTDAIAKSSWSKIENDSGGKG